MFHNSQIPFVDDNVVFSEPDFDSDIELETLQARKAKKLCCQQLQIASTVSQSMLPFFLDFIPNDIPFDPICEHDPCPIVPFLTSSEFDPMSMLNDDTRARNISAPGPLKRCVPSEPVTCNPIVLHTKPKLATCSLRNERSLIIKRDLILEILGTAGSLTERDILKQIGDNRYSREIVRKLLQDKLIYRVGKGGAKDPFKYVVAENYHGPDKDANQARNAGRTVDKKMAKMAFKIYNFLLEAKSSLTEAEIRHQIGDNPGTGAALRWMVSIGHVQKIGLGSRASIGDPFRYHPSNPLEPIGLDCLMNSQVVNKRSSVEISTPQMPHVCSLEPP